jgi:hypothetical protein
MIPAMRAKAFAIYLFSHENLNECDSVHYSRKFWRKETVTSEPTLLDNGMPETEWLSNQLRYNLEYRNSEA